MTLTNLCTATLAQLVAFDSSNPTGQELPLVEYLRQRLNKLAPTELLVHTAQGAQGRPTAAVYARWGAPRTVINVHLDTVAVTPGWRADPFVLRSAGDRLIGLGAADTKGAIAAALVALEQLPHGPQNCAVLFSGDEEQANACLPSFLTLPQARDIHTVVVCEPTNMQVGHSHRGLIVLQAAVAGQSGHSCFADTLTAPIADLCRVGVALSDWARHAGARGGDTFPGLCLNLANITGGTDYNIIPAAAQLLVSLRPSPIFNMPALYAELKSCIAGAAPHASVTEMLMLPPFATHDMDAYRPHLGDLCNTPVALGFWTEAAMWSAAGANAVVFGPGHMSHAHAAEEFVSSEQLVTTSQIFARMLSQA